VSEGAGASATEEYLASRMMRMSHQSNIEFSNRPVGCPTRKLHEIEVAEAGEGADGLR
jgi:hypothetical protein